jgi:hypothetical protein
MRPLPTVLLSATILALSACMRPDKEHAKNSHLTGTWLQAVPGMPDMKQGFTLLPDGSARSENMATLRYSSWSVHSDTLLLTGESLGNGERFLFTDTLVFSFPHTDTLVLGQQGFLNRFARNN